MKKITTVLLTVMLLVTLMPQAAFGEAPAQAETVSEVGETIEGVASFGSDKKLVSAGETVTLEMKVEGDLKPLWIDFKRPITGKERTVYFKESAEKGTYLATMDITDEIEAGLWEAKLVTMKSPNGEYLYYGDNYTGIYSYEQVDLTALGFEVYGTHADVTPPIIKGYYTDKKIVSKNESIDFYVEVEDENPSASASLWYKDPNGKIMVISMDLLENSSTYKGSLLVTDEMAKGIYKPYEIQVSDYNNSVVLYNSEFVTIMSNIEDMSSMNFEIIEAGISDDQENHIVIFTDGAGKTLSTQRVADGDSAVAPEKPVRNMYIFDGWDADYSNVTENLTVNAKWKKDPNAQYDRYIHEGESFEISLSSRTDQEYIFEWDEKDADIRVTYKGSSSISIGSSWREYTKTYQVQILTPGYYHFTIKGSAGGNALERTVSVSAHNYERNKVEPTCTEKGVIKQVCTICNGEYVEEYIDALGHSFGEYASDNNVTCTENGTKTAKCKRCGVTDTVVDQNALAKGHQFEVINAKAATCTESGYTGDTRCTVCKEVLSTGKKVDALGHSYADKIVEPTDTQQGYTIHSCKRCSDSYIDTYVEAKIFQRLFKSSSNLRIYGKSRYETATEVSETIKKGLAKNQHDNMIVACGDNYADALAGSYLAKIKNAPILLVDKNNGSEIKKYIDKNLKKGGTVYILGREGAVSKSFENSLAGYNVKRLGGQDRFGTNIEILKEAGVTNEDILVCSGMDFADSLSASAAGKPILLVDKKLNDKQTAYLGTLKSKNYYIIGGTGAVNNTVAKEIKKYGVVKRVSGQNRYETSVEVAKAFFGKDCDTIVLAYGLNFPDGLSGGPLALSLNAPLILTTSNDINQAKTYVQFADIKRTVTLGGPALISDNALNKICM